MRIDAITAIDGVAYEDARRDCMKALLAGVDAAVLSVHHLIANKKAAGRLQDLADVERLEELRRRR